jgi:hypothetical protein
MSESVYIAIMVTQYDRQMYKVFPANEHQTSAYLTFKSNNYDKINFKYPRNINFSLEKFYRPEDEYSHLSILKNERGESHILSDNETKLKAYIAYYNRLTEPIGGKYKKKKVTKKKITKKKI